MIYSAPRFMRQAPVERENLATKPRLGIEPGLFVVVVGVIHPPTGCLTVMILAENFHPVPQRSSLA